MELIELKSGLSVEGQEIKALKTEVKADKYTYLLAGVHGEEVEGIFVLGELIKWIKAEEELSVPLIIIPILNVDGYRLSSRVNANGVDLNRNLPAKSWKPEFTNTKYNPGSTPLSEPENKYLLKLFEKYPPSLMISFHSFTGRPMINYNGDGEDIAVFLGESIPYQIVSDEIEGHPTPGSLGQYLVETYKIPVITLEYPEITTDHNLHSMWGESQAGLKALLKSNLLGH